MKRNLSHIWRALATDPWIIRPETHRTLCDIVRAHASGAAHLPGGIVSAMPMPEMPDDEDDMPKYKMAGRVAIVPVCGIISNRIGQMDRISGACDCMEIVEAMRAAESDPAVSAIVMDVDSPGGTVAGVPEAADAIAAIEKPVIAWTGGQCCSAAYWLASAADVIYASASSTVGSIGCYMALLDESRAYEMAGMKIELMTTGENKGVGIPGTRLTDAQRAQLQSQVDHVFGMFSTFVSSRRKLADGAMDGRAVYGGPALALGMIDAVEDMITACRDAYMLSDIKR